MKYISLSLIILFAGAVSACSTSSQTFQRNQFWDASNSAARIGGTSVNWNTNTRGNKRSGNLNIRNNNTGNSRNVNWNRNQQGNQRSGNLNIRNNNTGNSRNVNWNRNQQGNQRSGYMNFR